jgi:hypothetical protein
VLPSLTASSEAGKRRYLIDETELLPSTQNGNQNHATLLLCCECIVIAQFSIANHSEQGRCAELPLKTIGESSKFGRLYAIRSSGRTAFSCVTREVLQHADRMVGRIIRPCVVEEGGLTECIDHRLWCRAVHGSGAASESVRAPGLVCSDRVCSALARPVDR